MLGVKMRESVRLVHFLAAPRCGVLVAYRAPGSLAMGISA